MTALVAQSLNQKYKFDSSELSNNDETPFLIVDTFEGEIVDPQSLHKYAYVHGDPVNGVDPSGEFIVTVVIGFAISSQIRKTDFAKNASAKTAILGRLGGLMSVAGFGLYESLMWAHGGNSVYESWVRARATGKGGADVTNALRTKTDSIATWWRNELTDSQSDQLTDFAISGVFSQNSMYSFSGWDISPFNGDINAQRSAFAGNVQDWAERSVTVDRHVYYAHEVNYFIWGAAHALASERNTEHARKMTKSSMASWVTSYRRHTDFAYIFKPYDGTAFGRVAWARAGWDYIKTGQFKPPTDYRLPQATANDDLIFHSNSMAVQLGPYFP